MAIRRGKLLEKGVLKELEKDLGVIETTGLILVSPIIGVSPDGICKDFALKCITNIKLNAAQSSMMLHMHAAKK